MSLLEQYRPPGRSNRSGRAQADNDVFEGLPVKQWGQGIAHISLAPPKSETENGESDKWGEPPMPRDYQLLQPWTQQLLRLARSGKVGTKRKPDSDFTDDDKPEDEVEQESKPNLELRGYAAKKWKPVPETMLEPEHKHFEFLAKRRKGLPSLYGPEVQNGAPIAMRKTKVQRIGADGEVAVYEVLVPEGRTVEGEVPESAELADVKPVAAAPGTVIEGVGIANEDGVVVAEHLKPNVAPRRNRPPPKKKGGPGRGKKRVTFTNPDGSTYTTIVPNATKIVPQPGQTVKHVAKGEEATADVSAAQAAANAPAQSDQQGEGEEGEEGEGSDDGDDEGDEDDDREEGELSDDDAPTAGATPVPGEKKSSKEATPAEKAASPPPNTEPTSAPAADTPDADARAADVPDADAGAADVPDADAPAASGEIPPARDASSSPELPLAKTSHSRQSSLVTPTAPTPTAPAPEAAAGAVAEAEVETEAMDTSGGEPSGEHKDEDGEEDLLGNLEKSLHDQQDTADANADADADAADEDKGDQAGA